MKICTVCKQKLNYEQYHKSRKTKDGYGYRCKECDKKARASYRETNKARFAEVSRRKSLKFRYGISLEQYNKLLESQKGVCAICGTDHPIPNRSKTNTSFSVDHCHKTGQIRGLLCSNCNRGLGLLGDTVQSLTKALEYLNETH